MQKYSLNPWFRKPAPCEIFMDQVIVSKESDRLVLHFVDVVGNLGSISLPLDKADKFIQTYMSTESSCVELNREVLSTTTNEFKNNYRYDSNIFQMSHAPEKTQKIISLEATAIGSNYNLISGCLGFNAYLMLSVVVNYSQMNEYLYELFSVSEWNQQSENNNMDIWIFFNKNDAKKLKKELELFQM